MSPFMNSMLGRLRCKFPDAEEFSYPFTGITVVIIPEFTGSEMVRVAVSTCSENEQEFRRKVGLYHAYNKMLDGEFSKFRRPCNFEKFADGLACAVAST